MTKDEALKMAIDFMDLVIEFVQNDDMTVDNTKLNVLLDKAHNACKEALEQPAQEPVAWSEREIEIFNGMIEVQQRHADQCLRMMDDPYGNATMAVRQLEWDNERIELLKKCKKLYTHPHQWQGLTDDEIEKVFESIETSTTHRKIYHAIEQALKEKNT